MILTINDPDLPARNDNFIQQSLTDSQMKLSPDDIGKKSMKLLNFQRQTISSKNKEESQPLDTIS